MPCREEDGRTAVPQNGFVVDKFQSAGASREH